MLHRTSVALGLWLSVLAAASAADDGRALTFEQDIRPIFRAHCLDCHGAEETLQGGLDLRQARFAIKGGESGSAVTAGDPAASNLLTRVRSGEMPPGELKVTPAELATLTEWVRQGAKTVRPEPETLPPGLGITPEERAWWAFQPLRRPEVPQVQSQQLVRTPIDAFLLQTLERNGLTFSPEADKATLVRRAYLDLLGLPPTVEEVDQFVQDDSAGAWERLIERLLESPRYGERWGRQWLDVAGYADSDGFTNDDPVRPYAYKYRDYVIRSLNADKPFNQFLVEQLAGDELVAPPYQNLTSEQQELLIATGFLRMAVDGTSSGGVDQDVARNQVVSDTLKIVSTSLLGLSVGWRSVTTIVMTRCRTRTIMRCGRFSSRPTTGRTGGIPGSGWCRCIRTRTGPRRRKSKRKCRRLRPRRMSGRRRRWRLRWRRSWRSIRKS